ncbi:MAG: hypothetical protein R3242_03675 [Akkermansiaceae bacterium]|nr:hypothetical protein [Akkermansiaceae bacterium]
MQLSLSELVVLVVAGSMGLVLLFALISHSHRMQALARATARTVVCRLCQHAYQQAGRDAISECPQCGARNHRREHQAPR